MKPLYHNRQGWGDLKMANFLDKITNSVNKGVATVGTGSKTMMEKARIKTVIKNLEAENENLVKLLGTNVYEKYSQGGEIPDDENIANFIMEIRNCKAGIEKQQMELQRLDNELSQVTGNFRNNIRVN